MTTHPYRPGIPEEILALSRERDILRRRGQYDRADLLKQKIEAAGYIIKDNPHGAHLVILPSINVDGTHYNTVRELPSWLSEPDLYTFSVHIHAQNTTEEARRCIESVLKYADTTPLEILVLDNASQDGFDLWAEALRHRDPRVHLVRTSRYMPLAEARNVALKLSRGRYIVLLDSNTELTGDIFAPLAQTLSEEEVGLTGMKGLHTEDMRHFAESTDPEVEVIDSTCMAFKRTLLNESGLFDERYRFPYYMDIDFSFALRDVGAETIRTLDLPIICHPEVQNSKLPEAERARLHKRNFYRYLEKWGDRDDLLLNALDDEDEDEDDQDTEEE